MDTLIKIFMSIIALVMVVVIFLGAYGFNLARENKVAIEKLGGRTTSPVYTEEVLETDVSAGSFANGTTTPVAVQNPQNATSTIDLFLYDITGVATSTHDIGCGTSTTAYNWPVSNTLIASTTVATSSKMTIAAGTPVYGSYGSFATADKLIVGPTQWVVCKVMTKSNGYYDSAITAATNTYDGKYAIRWNRLK